MTDEEKPKAQLLAELAALRQSEAYYRTLFDTARDGIITCALDGTITNVNRGLEKMLSWSKAEQLGRHYREFLTPASLAFMEERARQIQAGEQVSSIYEVEFLRKDGRVVSVEASSEFIRNCEGQPIGILAIHRDISARKQAEDSIQGYAEIVRNMQIGLYVYHLEDLHDDRTLRLVATNPAATQFTGVAMDSLIGKTLDENFPGLRAQGIPQTYAEVVRSGQAVERESVSYGDERVLQGAFSVKAFPLPNQCVGVVFENITARKQAEEALRQSEARFQRIATNFPGGMIFQFLLRSDGSMAFPYVSPNARDLYEMEPEEIQRNAARVFALVHPEDRAGLDQSIARSAQTLAPWCWEFRLITASGTLKWFRGVSRPERQANGDILWDGLVTDITDRKRAEEAAQQEAQITAALAQVGRELIGSFDTLALLQRLCQLITEVLKSDCSHVLLWQPQTGVYVPMASHGHAPEQWEALRTLTVSAAFLNDLLAQLEHEEVVSLEVAKVQSLPLRVFAQQSGLTAMLVTTLRRGTKIIGLLTAAYREHPVPFTPQEVRMLRGTGRLASVALEKARLLEELQQANQAKSEFLATMSHELRTPLGIVIGYTDLLLEEYFGPMTAEQNATLQRVRGAARQEVELITTLLDLSRLEAGRVRLTMSAVDMSELIAELRQETENSKGKPGLRFEWRVAPNVPLLWTDRFHLKVILTNLIGNAVKFTELGRILVAVSPHAGGVECGVTDTGRGITPEVQAVMFEMFRQGDSQGDSATTHHYEGVGLGLYIVKRLLELLHGTIVVESVVRKGSTFRVRIPQGSQRTSERVESDSARGLKPLGTEGQAGEEH